MTHPLRSIYDTHNNRGPVTKFLIEIVLAAFAMLLFMVALVSVVAFVQWDTSVYYEEGYNVYRFAFIGGAIVAGIRGVCIHIIPIIDPSASKENNS